LKDHIARLEKQKLAIKTLIFEQSNHEERIRLSGKIEGINIAIENLRQQLTEIEHDNN
jgi:hypothetical protein